MWKRLDIVLFLVYALASVSGLTIVKFWFAPAADAWRDGSYLNPSGFFVALGSTLYIASFCVWIVLLGRNQLSMIYPMAIGATLIGAALTAVIFLDEDLSWHRIVGIGTILLGTILVARS